MIHPNPVGQPASRLLDAMCHPYRALEDVKEDEEFRPNAFASIGIDSQLGLHFSLPFSRSCACSAIDLTLSSFIGFAGASGIISSFAAFDSFCAA